MKTWYQLIILLSGFSLSCSAQQRKSIEVYLIGGQSNATGQGYVANMYTSMRLDRRPIIFHSGSPHLNSGQPPLHWAVLHQASESPDRFGPELGFGTTLQGMRRGKAIALIKHAHSGTNLYEQWNPGKNSADTANWGDQFKVFVSTVQSGLDSLVKMGYSPEIKGMLWQQGESDADKGDSLSANYGKNLVHFIRRVREQFRSPKLIFVYGYVYPPPNSGVGITQVRQAEHDIDQNAQSPLSTAGAFVVFTDDLSQRADDRNSRYPKDRIHFGTKGTWDLGVRMAQMMAAHLPR